MIRVLRSCTEIGNAIVELQKEECGYHRDAIKNWDLAQVNQILKHLRKDARILDMGCQGSNILAFCGRRGYKECIGIDVHIPFEDRLQQAFTMYRRRSLRPLYKLIRMDLTRTKFPDSCFDLIVCLSVIEHGVNIDSFLRESSRILRTDGILLVSTDYWEAKVPTDDVKARFAPRWNIFSKEEINELTSLARNYGLTMEDYGIEDVEQPLVQWLGKNYTFISMMFTRGKSRTR